MTIDNDTSHDSTKREFLTKATYVLPAVLTLAAAPSFASAGSGSRKAKKRENHYKHPKKVKLERKK